MFSTTAATINIKNPISISNFSPNKNFEEAEIIYCNVSKDIGTVAAAAAVCWKMTEIFTVVTIITLAGSSLIVSQQVKK